MTVIKGPWTLSQESPRIILKREQIDAKGFSLPPNLSVTLGAHYRGESGPNVNGIAVTLRFSNDEESFDIRMAEFNREFVLSVIDQPTVTLRQLHDAGTHSELRNGTLQKTMLHMLTILLGNKVAHGTRILLEKRWGSVKVSTVFKHGNCTDLQEYTIKSTDSLAVLFGTDASGVIA